MSLFTYCIRVWGVAAYTKYLGQIDRLLRRAFRFGYIQHETSIQHVFKDRDFRLRKSIVGTPSRPLQDLLSQLKDLRAGLYAGGRILTRSQVLMLRGLRNALPINVSLILNRL